MVFVVALAAVFVVRYVLVAGIQAASWWRAVPS
jgi:hypothetical protein